MREEKQESSISGVAELHKKGKKGKQLDIGAGGNQVFWHTNMIHHVQGKADWQI